MHPTESPATECPPIGPLPNVPARPLWSVMIPTYNRVTFLREALESVLQQDPGADQMQIEVVDDCSPDVDPSDVVTAVGRGRVSFHRQPVRLGISANWTDCVRRARGSWVHILHEDDVVLPGFYDTLRQSLEREPGVGAAFTRHAFTYEDGQWWFLSPLEQPTPGVLPNWLERIAVQQRIQCPAIVVRRSVYESLGGFHPQLYYAVDWEMWKRIASRYPVWYEPRILACFRQHDRSFSHSLDRSGLQLSDVRRSIDISRSYFPEEQAQELDAKARAYWAFEATDRTREMLMQGHARAAVAAAREAMSFSPSRLISLRVWKRILGFCFEAGMWRARLAVEATHPGRH
jgi:glycosyltransferase involved in cell wall biosynthesis